MVTIFFVGACAISCGPGNLEDCDIPIADEHNYAWGAVNNEEWNAVYRPYAHDTEALMVTILGLGGGSTTATDIIGPCRPPARLATLRLQHLPVSAWGDTVRLAPYSSVSELPSANFFHVISGDAIEEDFVLDTDHDNWMVYEVAGEQLVGTFKVRFINEGADPDYPARLDVYITEFSVDYPPQE